MIYSKYHAKKTTLDGIKFASKKEAQHYAELKLLERAGVIRDLQLQVPFILVDKSKYGRAIKYIADFTYYKGDQFVVVDVKGYKTDVYKIKARLFAERYGFNITEINN